MLIDCLSTLTKQMKLTASINQILRLLLKKEILDEQW